MSTVEELIKRASGSQAATLDYTLEGIDEARKRVFLMKGEDGRIVVAVDGKIAYRTLDGEAGLAWWGHDRTDSGMINGAGEFRPFYSWHPFYAPNQVAGSEQVRGLVVELIAAGDTPGGVVAASEDVVTVSHSAVLAWLEKEATERGDAVSDLDEGSFGGETITEEIAALIGAADSESLFVGPPDLPKISVNAYTYDFDAVVLSLRPSGIQVGLPGFARGQIASYATDVDHLAVGESGTERILSVLDAIAAEVSGLIHLYRSALAREPRSPVLGGSR